MMRIPESWSRIPFVTRRELAHRVDLAVEHSFQKIRRRIKDGNPTEPDRILSFFLNGLEEIEDNWNPLLALHGVQVSVSGIFIHSTPKVIPTYSSSDQQKRAETRFSTANSRSCELGDLLVIVTHEGGDVGAGNAIIFQAKDGFPEHGDAMQRRLYEEAGGFSYTSQRSFGRASRLLPAKDSGALSYWDIKMDRHRWAFHPYLGYRTTTLDAADARICDADADPTYSRGRNVFGETIQRLVFSDSGEQFAPPTPGNSDWDQIIRDLVEKTAKRALTAKMVNTHGIAGNRGTEGLARAIAADPNGPVVGRNSISEVYHHLAPDDSEIASLGKKLEESALKPDDKELDPYRKNADGRGGFWPPLKPQEPQDEEPDEGGMNLIMIHCSGS